MPRARAPGGRRRQDPGPRAAPDPPVRGLTEAPLARTRGTRFTPAQRTLLGVLAGTVGLRMLGLFLVLPVFTLYGLQFTRSRFLVGLAFGSYGLTMALLQIPFGRLSDRLGRRPVLVFGMALFSAGSFLCAIPPWMPEAFRIGTLIVGRLVQGGGAIVSVAFAAVADHITPDRRSTAMAILGIPIGVAFGLGVIGGPLLAGALGTPALFWMTGALGLGTVVLLLRYLPGQPSEPAPPAPGAARMRLRPLLALGTGGFLMNFFMATFFFYFPLIATGQHHLTMTRYYALLVPMMLVSGVTMFGFSRGADRGWAQPLAALAFFAFVPSSLLLFWPQALGFDPHRLTAALVGGTLFYVGFTGLEPILPSLVSRSVAARDYGSALGVYNSLQFFGSFAGGGVAGLLSRFSAAPMLGTLLVAALAGGALMLSRPVGALRRRPSEALP